jgi:hypothetical protein
LLSPAARKFLRMVRTLVCAFFFFSIDFVFI